MNKSNYKIINKGFTPTPNFIKKVNLVWGFTLVELMVVISIFVIITTITIFNYGDFRSSVSLQNLTDDIALSIRKAQGFAVGARGVETGTDVVFTNSYGMHFSINSNGTGLEGSDKSFVMFASTDKVYDKTTGACGGVLNECIEVFNITSADKIEEIWLNGTQKMPQNSSVDVIFTRPDTRASFCYRPTFSSSCLTDYSEIKIVISNGQTDESGKRKTKSISVQNTGQISIE